MTRIAKGAAWALAALVIVFGIAYVALYLLILSYPFQPYGFPGAVILFCIPGAIFGALIVSRQPRNEVGWALLLSGFFLALTATAQLYTTRAIFVDPGSLPLSWMSAWFGSWMWAPGVAITTVFLPLLFPDSSLRGWPARETLRDLARGIYPPLLADKGLAAALEAQACKATLPVEVSVDGVGRYTQDVEAAVCFCCLEALQNVQKYGYASAARVRLAQADGLLTVAVEDDGRGFDPSTARKGSGLQNMEDRLDALGGTVEIESSPGSGATVTVRLPIDETVPV